MAQKMYRPDFSTAKDARVLQTRSALRKALLKLLKKKSFDTITVREVVAMAGVGYNTFFRHYPSKDSILDDIAADEINQLLALSYPILEAANPRASCLALCGYVWDNRMLWKTLLTGGAAATLRQEFIRSTLEIAISSPSKKAWLPIEAAVIVAASGTFELLAWWLGEKKPLPVDELATIYQRLVLAPLVTP